MPKAVITMNLKGLDGMIKAMDDVAKPTFLTTMKLEAVFQEVFAMTQENVHVISGDLKRSGDTDTDFNGKVWSGEITYGQGINYARIELEREGIRTYGTNHPPHDWLSGLEVFDAKFEDAIDSHFKLTL